MSLDVDDGDSHRETTAEYSTFEVPSGINSLLRCPLGIKLINIAEI